MAWIEEKEVVGEPMIDAHVNSEGKPEVCGFEIVFTGKVGAVVEKTVSNICKFAELVSDKSEKEGCTLMLSCFFEDETEISEKTYKKIAHCFIVQHEAQVQLRKMCLADTRE